MDIKIVPLESEPNTAKIFYEDTLIGKVSKHEAEGVKPEYVVKDVENRVIAVSPTGEAAREQIRQNLRPMVKASRLRWNINQLGKLFPKDQEQAKEVKR